MSAVIEHLRARREESLAQLIEYLKIPCVSTTGTHVREGGEHLAGLMERGGLETRIMETAGHPAVFGVVKGPPRAPPLQL
jgi:acetylornithine deacetylase/succinyl-diaminopimelate desuccinylase-like protein